MPQWNWQEPPIQIAPRRAVENIEPIAGGIIDKTAPSLDQIDSGYRASGFALPSLPTPRPEAIAKFLRVVRSMNNDEEPDPEGPNAAVWRWLKSLCA